MAAKFSESLAPQNRLLTNQIEPITATKATTMKNQIHQAIGETIGSVEVFPPAAGSAVGADVGSSSAEVDSAAKFKLFFALRTPAVSRNILRIFEV